jgi:hypothetical protein
MNPRYGIAYLDMYDYGHSFRGPEYPTANAAIEHAQRVIDEFLKDSMKPGMTARELYEHFMMFGEDVVIAPIDGAPAVSFKGQAYVRKRAAELCPA